MLTAPKASDRQPLSKAELEANSRALEGVLGDFGVRGEIVKAFVTLRDGAKASDALARELQQHVKKVTAPYKYPRAIAFVDALPMTVTGTAKRFTCANC